jgi:hypothetical protein
MADVTIPTIGAGASNGTVVEQNFYNPTATGQTSAEIINGHLDNANRNAAWTIDRSQIQHGALSKGEVEGGTVNLDYFGQLFPGWNIVDDVSAVVEVKARMDSLYQTIPGAAVSFYLPYNTSMVVFSWNVFAACWQYDQENEVYLPAKIRFYLNNTRIPNKVFALPAKGYDASLMYGNFDRAWLGHHVATGLNKGWHSASLRVVVDPGESPSGSTGDWPACLNTQCRVRVRSMNYVYFR